MRVSGSLVHNYPVGGDTRAAAAEYRAGRVLCNAIPVRDAHDGIGMEISDRARAVCRVIRAVGNVLVSGPSGERNVRASCVCTRFPDANHPSSEKGLTLLQYFFSVRVHQNVVLTKICITVARDTQKPGHGGVSK